MALYLLYVDDLTNLEARSELFETHMEPLLLRLEHAVEAGQICSPDVPEIHDYLQVCRWPFRKLEYSFVLDVLLPKLHKGARFLDAGSGITPLAHIFAAQGCEVDACDADQRLIQTLTSLDVSTLYGSSVTYRVEDLTDISFEDETFDAISCVSVLEHIPAPDDQRAIRELIRVLKPGGVLVVTVDFAPRSAHPRLEDRSRHYFHRTIDVLRSREIGEFWRAAERKRQARKAVHNGLAQHTRGPNQRYELTHIEEDILPVLAESGSLSTSSLCFPAASQSLSSADIQRFWNLVPGLYDIQSERDVIPLGIIFQKSGT